MASRVKSNIPEFQRALRRATAVGLKRAAIFTHAECRKAVNVANTGEKRKRTRNTVAGAKGSQYTVYENPSKPGEPPHKITGTGQSHIVHEYNDNEKAPAVRIGVSKGGIHMAYLELGTKRIAARPWLGMKGVLGKFWKQIAALAATGGRGEIR